ncbi:transcriptional regulator family: Fungal Specific TF [Aspergillus niger]|nr:transcriptional regulator family: Fungal Specific TF [Aspergillus niger]KAI2896895.1 transcriptional regulator family: Fungal Specific TF [Aspergillus niger]KAI3044770.1 transcriptional regulator family: Fungal Specific TF [Aspergillus niger]
MSESLTFSGDILPAIKCDRRAQCANCADAGVECQRRRRGRPPKKRSLQSALGPQENIVTFERQPPQTQRGNRQSGRRAVTRYLNRSPTLEHSQLDNQVSDSRERSPTTTAQSTPSVEGPNYHAIQAKNIIQLELNDSRHINRGRQSILRSALQLVNRIAESEPQHPDEIIEEPQPSDTALTIPDAPPRELLFMLLKGPPESICIQWPDHISRKTFEKMATALLEHESRLQDLSTIQALLSSALLMQHLGRLNQCWVLTSYAARQIASLNYHKIRRIPAHSDLELEVYSVVYWCYYLDRTLSSLLGRPPSLPDLEVSPTDLIVLDPCSPYDTLLHVLLDLAQVQGNLHGVSSCAKNVLNSQALETCQLLESRMQSILREMPSSRDSLPKMVQYDWVAVDFCYYAIFVEIDRTRLKSSFSPAIHRECLVHARKSLEAFHFLQQHPEEMPGFEEPYPSFLTWTLFFYPLSAFFVVICNIIGTLDHSDFELLQQITQSLSQFKQDPHLGKLLNLLQSLEDLCEPLFQVGNSGPENMSSNLGTSAPDQIIEPVTIHGILPSASFNNNFGLNDEPIPNPDLDASTDWLMWQLFNSQIPAAPLYLVHRPKSIVNENVGVCLDTILAFKIPDRSKRHHLTRVNNTSSPTMHSDNDAGFTVHCDSLKWLPLAPSVFIKIVKLVPETGEYTIMVRAEPGGLLPRHRHVESAEIYVLKGSGAHPQTGAFVQGDYVSESKGAVHDSLPFEHETELLMVSRGPSVFLADDGSDLYTMDVAMLQDMLERAK